MRTFNAFEHFEEARLSWDGAVSDGVVVRQRQLSVCRRPDYKVLSAQGMNHERHESHETGRTKSSSLLPPVP
ncbi:MAG: hypothetical protein U1E05_18330, partial [Patescibacteria group bacterium]|nr:hypothetical protein [Patescibacteria group bacterium]